VVNVMMQGRTNFLDMFMCPSETEGGIVLQIADKLMTYPRDNVNYFLCFVQNY
jgi:hypothetical protein